MNTAVQIVLIIQLLFFLYFVFLNGTYIVLSLLSTSKLWRAMQEREVEDRPRPYNGLEPPISLIVPAHNEGETISSNLNSLLHLEYPDYEIIVVNDGSTDKTMAQLQQDFALVPFPESNPNSLQSKPIRAVYHST